MGNSGKVVFVLGAGFSKDVAKLPITKDSEFQWPSLKNFAETMSSSTDSKRRKVMDEALTKYIGDSLPRPVGNNIEEILSYFSDSHPWCGFREKSFRRALFLHVLDIFARSLEEKEKNAVDTFLKNDHSKALVTLWHKRKREVAVFTFNYDTIIEKTFRQCVEDGAMKDEEGRSDKNLALNDLYHFPVMNIANRGELNVAAPGSRNSFPLYKLHGSVNWFFSGSQSFPGQSVYYDALDSENQEREEVDNNKRDLIRFIVPPLIEKSSHYFSLLMGEQWKRLTEYIEVADHVIFLGYSLPDLDLYSRFAFQDALKLSNAKLHLFFQEGDCNIKRRFEAFFDRDLSCCSFGKNNSSVEKLLKHLEAEKILTS